MQDKVIEYALKAIKTPVGGLNIVSDGKSIRAIYFDMNWKSEKKNYPGIRSSDSPLLRKAAKQLEEYFAGKRKDFDFPYALTGTEFQKKIWSGLKKIPYGKTYSYKQQAERAGSPKAVRAVGRTNGLNPLCIVLPCHRVIGSNGSLTGYAGGLDKKKFLLNLEAAL